MDLIVGRGKSNTILLVDHSLIYLVFIELLHALLVEFLIQYLLTYICRVVHVEIELLLFLVRP